MKRILATLLLLVLVLGCEKPPTPTDAGERRTDASPLERDADVDAGTDAGSNTPDAGPTRD